MVFQPNDFPTEYRLFLEENRAPAGGQENAGIDFLAASDIARRVHRAVEKAGVQEPERVGPARVELTQSIRFHEQRLLKQWAAGNQLLRPWDAFESAWMEGGEFSGGEHDVYFQDGRVWKRHVAEDAPDFGTYFSYFNRMALHNALFPESPYRLEGFTEKAGGVLMTILSQPEVAFDPESWVEESEVDAWMARRGFRKMGLTSYLSNDGFIEVADLHSENVVIPKAEAGKPVGKRLLAVIDGDINLVPASWHRRA